MKKVFSLYKKEMVSYFASPTTYIFATLFLAITGLFFWLTLVDSREGSMRNVFSAIAPILLFVTPMLTMRLIAEERKTGTLELLFTSPLSSSDIILAKFLAAFSLYGIMFLFTLMYPIILFSLGDPELWPMVGGYIGLLLMAGCYTSVGLLASCLTENQLVAGIISFSFLMTFLLLQLLQNFIPVDFIVTAIRHINFFQHYEGFGKGLLSLPDLLYFGSFIFLTLFLSVRILEIERSR